MNGIYTLLGLRVPSQVSLAQEPETSVFPSSAMQGSHGVSTLEKGPVLSA